MVEQNSLSPVPIYAIDLYFALMQLHFRLQRKADGPLQRQSRLKPRLPESRPYP